MGVLLGSIVAAATTVANSLAVVGLAVQGIKAIGNVIVSLGKALGLIKPETKVDELGDKALQSGFDPNDERFNGSYAQYVKAVEEYKLDPEKSKLYSEDEKIKKGMELVAGATIEKYEGFPVDRFFGVIAENPDFFTPEKMGEIANLMEKDSQNIPNILNFINGEEKNDVRIENVVDALVAVEKSVNPAISDIDAIAKVMELRK